MNISNINIFNSFFSNSKSSYFFKNDIIKSVAITIIGGFGIYFAGRVINKTPIVQNLRNSIVSKAINNPTFMLTALKMDPRAVQLIDPENSSLIDNRVFMLNALRTLSKSNLDPTSNPMLDIFLNILVSSRLNNNPNFMLEAIDINLHTIRSLSNKLINDPDFIIEVLENNQDLIELYPSHIKLFTYYEPDFMLKILKIISINGSKSILDIFLKILHSNPISNNSYHMLEAIHINPKAIQSLSSRLIESFNFLNYLIEARLLSSITLYENLDLTLNSVNEISENPINILIELSKYKIFPKIKYRDNPGQDDEGLTQDLMTRLFTAIIHSSLIPMEKKDDEWLPLATETRGFPSLPDQIKIYKAIGLIFQTAIFNGSPIGFGFHLVLFKMIHAYLLEKASIPNDIESIHDIPQPIQKVMFIALAESFNLTEEQAHLIWDGDSEYLQSLGIETRDEFFESYNIKESILAAALIAKDQSHTGFFIKAFEDSEIFKKVIEGSISKDQVMNAFQGDEKLSSFCKRWVENASNEEVEDLVFCITGAKTLPQNCILNITGLNTSADHLPNFQTCFKQINMPYYQSYEVFADKLNEAIMHAKLGFQLA